MSTRCLLTLSLVGYLSAAATAADLSSARLQNWHQWRGPLANGTAPEGNPPVEWSQDKNIRWKVEIPGKGSATPIVWENQIFVVTAVETERKAEGVAAVVEEEPEPEPEPEADSPRRRRGRRGGRGRSGPPTNYVQFNVMAIDPATGETIWQQTAAEVVPHEGHHPTNNYASASPTTDGNRLYVSFGSRGLFCYDLDGNLRWERQLGQMQTRNGFGEGSSPTIHGDALVVNWDHEGESFITVLDAATGESRWKVDRDERTTWGTPLVVDHDGRSQVIINASNRVRSYDLATGELIWECGGQAGNPIPSPVVLDDVVYCMTGFRGFALYAIPLDAMGDITDSETIAWSRDEGTPYVPSPLLYGETLFFTKSNNAILSSVAAKTGDVVIDQERLPGLRSLYASPVGAANRIYITSREGTTLVLARGEEVEVLATNELEEPIDASPAVVGDTMYLRGEKHLYAIAED